VDTIKKQSKMKTMSGNDAVLIFGILADFFSLNRPIIHLII